MAGPFFVDDAGDGSDGLTWAKAYTTLDAAIAGSLTAGDTIYMGHNTVDSQTSQSMVFPGTPSAPNIIISADNTSGEPPTTYTKATVAQVEASSGTILIDGSVKFYGVYLKASDRYDYRNAGDVLWFDDSTLEDTGTSNWLIGDNDDALIFTNTDIQFTNGTGNAALCFRFVNSGLFRWYGGTLTYSGSTQPTAVFGVLNSRTDIDWRGITLSDITSTLIDISDATIIQASFANCLVSTGLALTTGVANLAEFRVLMSNTDDATSDFLYRMEYETHYGKVVDEIAIVVSSGGASDGTVPISFKMSNNTHTENLHEPLISPPIPLWIDSTVEQKFVVQCIWGATTPNDHQVWSELEYYASGDTLSTFVDNGADNPLDTADTISTATGVSWDGGLSGGDAFSLELTVTPGRKGPAFVRIYFADDDGAGPDVLYYDPLVTVTAT